MKISFIIPVFNAAKYLHRCIDSLLAQTNPNWEALFTDDGSTDGSFELLQRIANKDNRIRVFQINHEGSSGARNKGLDNASGDLIGFIDADDYIHKQLVELSISHFESHIDCDMMSFGYKVVNPEDRYSLPSLPENRTYERVLDSISSALRPWNATAHSVWRMIVRRNALGDLRFYPGIKHQDLLFTYQLWGRISWVAKYPYQLYGYVQTPGSVIRSQYSIDKINANETIIRELTCFYRGNEQVLRLLRTRLFPRMIANVWKQAERCGRKDIVDASRTMAIRLYRERLVRLSGFSIKRRIKYLLLLLKDRCLSGGCAKS